MPYKVEYHDDSVQTQLKPISTLWMKQPNNSKQAVLIHPGAYRPHWYGTEFIGTPSNRKALAPQKDHITHAAKSTEGSSNFIL